MTLVLNGQQDTDATDEQTKRHSIGVFVVARGHHIPITHTPGPRYTEQACQMRSGPWYPGSGCDE